MHVSAGFTAQYEGLLYILSREKETGKVKVVKQISSQEELDTLSEAESNRDYKIYSNRTCGMEESYSLCTGYFLQRAKFRRAESGEVGLAKHMDV